MNSITRFKVPMAVFSIFMILVTACTPEALQSLAADYTEGVDNIICTETLEDIVVDDLIVPQNTTCTLNGTRVEGNITVEEDASLIAYGVSVSGNIQANKASQIEIHPDSYVGGNIQIAESHSLLVASTNIGGNLEADYNTGELIFSGNAIEGNLQIFNNMGGVSIQNNIIQGNIECEENDPQPNYSGNMVYGDRSGQCQNIDEMDENGMPYMTEDYECTGTLNAVTVYNLVVPMNATCTLNETQVNGDITVYENATLYAYAVRVEGDIEGKGAALVEIHPGSYIGSDVEFEDGGSLLISSVSIMDDLEVEESYGEITIIDSIIMGDVELEENSGEISLSNNTIEGDLEIEENTGGVSINNNVIYGDLECEDNYPAPDYSGNSVRGDRDGQCYMDEMEDEDDMDYDDEDDMDYDDEDGTYLGDDYECNSTLDSVIVDDLIVPMNAVCTISNSKINGNISVNENATLIAYTVTVEGNIQAQYASNVEIHPGSYVGGNIQFEDGGSLYVSSVQIKGNLEASDSWGMLTFMGNTIDGDIQVADNTGGITINNNIIYGDLECEENYPTPTGSGNTIYGDGEGQCMW